jgi:hypothetical protein
MNVAGVALSATALLLCSVGVANAEHDTAADREKLAEATSGNVSRAPRASILSGLEEVCREQGWGFWWDGERCLTNEETLSLSPEKAREVIRWRYSDGQVF